MTSSANSVIKKYMPESQLKIAVFLVLFLLVFLWPNILRWVFPEISNDLLPDYYQLTCAVPAITALVFIRCPYSLLTSWLWVAWYFVGVINTFASYYAIGSHYDVPVGQPTVIYWVFTGAYFFGLLTFEKKVGQTGFKKYGFHLDKNKLMPRSIVICLFLFPVLWFLSLYVSLGYVPMLSGGDITGDMYEINYGFIYDFGQLMPLAGLLAFVYGFIYKEKQFRYFLIFFLIMLISTADGKRQIAMIMIIGAIAVSLKFQGEKTWKKILPIFMVMAGFLYSLINALRADTSNVRDEGGGYSNLRMFGDEFRDFCYSIAHFDNTIIPEYDWFVSGLASMTNSSILSVFGFNKVDLVKQGSAYVWAGLFKTPFGIRTGIVSELWFAYHWWGVIIVFIFGILTGKIIDLFKQAESDKGVIFLSVIYAFSVLTIMGQTTAFTGSLTTLFYLYVVIFSAEKFLVIKS